jgi:CubicO group peptidase (beta-lactamase class C family)
VVRLHFLSLLGDLGVLAVKNIPRINPMPQAPQQLTDLITQLIDDGSEWGVQLVAYLDGECVVDLAMGVMDDKTQKPVTKDTLFPVFSISKGFTATLMHRLVARSELTYDTPICEVWPEFMQGGEEKKNILIKHVMGHVSGMHNMPMGIGMKEFCDWDAMCDAIAKDKPVYAPEAGKDYHAITYGFLLGEVMRRVDGRSVSQMLREEIALPLGVENDLFMGIPDDVEDRVATLMHVFPDGPPDTDSSIAKPIPGWTQPLYAMMNQSLPRKSCSPGSGGIMNAHAIARHYASLLPGGVDGVQLIDDATRALATTSSYPEIEGGNFGLGYALCKDNLPSGNVYPTFGHDGHGGSQGYADQSCKLAVGMTHNFFGPEYKGGLIMETLRKSLGLPA